jgi:hypothetical protein
MVVQHLRLLLYSIMQHQVSQCWACIAEWMSLRRLSVHHYVVVPRCLSDCAIGGRGAVCSQPTARSPCTAIAVNHFYALFCITSVVPLGNTVVVVRASGDKWSFVAAKHFRLQVMPDIYDLVYLVHA